MDHFRIAVLANALALDLSRANFFTLQSRGFTCKGLHNLTLLWRDRENVLLFHGHTQ